MYDYNVLNYGDGIISIMERFKIIDTYNLIHSIRPHVTIMMYHHIGTEKNDYLPYTTKTLDFEKQMRYLRDTHEIISFEKLIQAVAEKKSLPKRTAIITFDDGYKDNYTEAFPILKKYKIPATIFLTTGHIENDNIFWWNKIGYVLYNTKLKKIELEGFGEITPPRMENAAYSLRLIFQRFKKIPEEKRKKLIDLLIQKSEINIPKDMDKDLMMSWDNIREMNENGLDFGAHTVTHPILTNLTLNQAKFEIVESKKIIEKKLNKTITTFCYPNGSPSDYNSDIIKILRDNGFLCAVTAIPKAVTLKSDMFELGRFPPGYDFKSFKLYISGLYSVLNRIVG